MTYASSVPAAIAAIAAATGAAEAYKHEVIVRRVITDELEFCRYRSGYG